VVRFANAAAAAETLEEVFDAALTAIVETLRVARASILLLDDDGVMRLRLSRGDPAVLEGNSPLEIPLVSREQLIGELLVYNPEPHAFTTTDIAAAGAIANHLASVVARFRAVAELERSVRDNDLFAGVLAHDLRNPLGAVVTATQLAMRHNGDERVTKALARILTSTERMSSMIAQLLDFARVRVGGGISLHPRRASLVEIARHAVSELELVHPDRELAVTVHGDPFGVWDRDRLLQVMSNLVGNACQHGGPARQVAVAIDGRAADAVVLSVGNDGVIPAALRPVLFEPFRGRDDRDGDGRGLGLGLFIVREIVRAHHGSIDVTSTASQGTTFVVCLPRG
jgi:signal transduction histidine kinase